MSRALKPRATAALSVAPATVTDLTCAAVLGLEARPFRELLAREKVPHARLGRRVVARVEDVLQALDRLSAAPAEGSGSRLPLAPEDEDDDGGDQPQTADEVLRRLGKVRAG